MTSLTLLIPTFNRTKKLKRTLLHYKEFVSESIKIYILDASYKDMKKEIKIKLPKNFIFKKYSSNLTYTERIYKFIQETKIDTNYICIGNDEDIITSKYLYNSVNFLNKNPEYAGYYGSVLTFLRPFFIFPRLSLHKSSPPSEIYIDSENKIERIITYLTLNLNNLPFTFYSVRRTKDFLNLYNKIHKLDLYEISEEVLDQIHIASSGKLFFGKEIMIIRDETKNNYVIEDNRPN